MSQNTEQSVRTRDAQVDALYHGRNTYSTITQDRFRYELVKAEARGAEEQRRKDGEGSYEAKDEGANYVLKSLASIFGRDGFDIRDGSESWEGDVHATLSKLLDDCGLTVEGEPSNVVGIDVDAVIQNASELPDRTSPEGQPDFLMITADELRLILSEAQPANVAALEARVKELEGENAALQAWKIGAVPEPVPYSAPIRTMSTEQLCQRLQVLRARWDELMDSDEEMGGGSPMESMDEEMQSLKNEISRRAALTREGGV
ncbi:hypothetical protein [Gluconobacter thailandicus]|uniref:Uncharacterized protein n=1 Tax=Gluconobacter thailandicus TaxID=257438 RepID=A0AAP9EV68_GLUTH|nr:hypothetical protein [Gluconobacter thailandicus]QEH97327.1 hypothetical protein FXF46_14495 [Gluconobacter thailandicus]